MTHIHLQYAAGWGRPFNKAPRWVWHEGLAVCVLSSTISDHSSPQSLRSVVAFLRDWGLQREGLTPLVGEHRPDHLYGPSLDV